MPVLEELKAQIARRLPELDMVIGWGHGYDCLHRTPVFIENAADIEKLVFDPLCVHNLSTYLTRYGSGKKIGVVVKGCDSRSVVELLQEKLINRDNIVVFGLPCEGVADLGKVKRALQEQNLDMGRVKSATVEGGKLILAVSGKEVALALNDVLADKCGRCRYHNAVIHDEFAGTPVEGQAQDAYEDLAAFENQTLEERMEFWRGQMERCVRCYACRNACPMCVCRDHCIAQSRDPNWVSQGDGLEEKFFFQMIHAMHLAGRCTECGECERACPVDIPLLLLKRKLGKEIQELFDYRAGTEPEVKPPLLAFKVEEDNINERGW
ncbi:4Fe-4S dicluster domain-containing protein [Fundidesulfovibrio terrae]|uniref:4Fe-4S dicluster domain-containing protein n=1 Tax=Fundidesulfovibrio terrae TaxID=2922866 RepID=UPI001FAF1684|nr:4Fe-4S dicluster domain-containing protein [Fundidesulfovibrio terrae]